MSWFERFCFAVLVWVVAFLLATGARGDERLENRLSALRSVTIPSAESFDVGFDQPEMKQGSNGFLRRCVRRSRRPAYQDPEFDLRVTVAVRDASARFGLDPRLIRSVIRHESAYNTRALSHAGAMGLMQLMPTTARSLGVLCPYDARENILAGARYLRAMYDRFGEWPRAVAAYHAGPTRVAAGRVPAETHLYVRRVMRTWRYPY
jgi:soluble lytic murein transglycosylase-like protein